MPNLVTPRPFRPALSGGRVILIGDSLAGGGDAYDNVGGSSPTAASWFNWARGFLGDPLDFASNDGVGGETTVDMLSRVDTVAAKSGEIVALIAGANDFGTAGSPSRLVIDNLRTMLHAFHAQGKHVVLFTVPPSENYDTAAKRAAVLEANEWIRNLRRSANLTIVDAYTVLADGAPNVFKSGMAYDSVHWSHTGAMAVGKAAANAMADLFPQPFTEWHGPDSADNVIDNPLFEGSASEWSAVDGTLSLEASSEHEGNVAVLTLSGATDNNPRVELASPKNISDGTYSASDVLVLKADVEWNVTAAQSDVDFLVPDIQLQARNSGGTFDATLYALQPEGTFATNHTNALMKGRGVWRTAAYTVGASVDRLYMRFGMAGAETGTVKCHRFSIYKV